MSLSLRFLELEVLQARQVDMTHVDKTSKPTPLTWPSPPVGNDAKPLTSSVDFFTMSRVASVRLCL